MRSSIPLKWVPICRRSSSPPAAAVPPTPAPPVPPVPPVPPAKANAARSGDELTMQNRDRSRAAARAQMQDIRKAPDPERLGFSRDPNTGAPMVGEGRAIPDADKGRADAVVMASGRRVPVRYAVVEADDLAASHNADGQVNPDYAAAPLKALNNGRTAGLQAAYASGNTDAYRAGITADAALHGVSAEAIASKRRPVLVRLYDPSANTGDMGAESNASAQLGLSPVEQAQTDARALPDMAGLTWSEDGNLPLQGNVDFFRKWFRNMGEAQAASLQDSQGRPNAAAMQRVRGAMIHRAYGDERLLTAAAEEVNPENRNVINALTQAAPAFAALEQNDPLTGEIRGALVGGLEVLRDASARGLSLTDALAQGDLMGRNAHADTMAAFMAANARSAKRMAEAFNALAEYAGRGQAQAATLDVFGTAPTPTVGGALEAANIGARDAQSDTRVAEQDAGQGYRPRQPAAGGRTAPGDSRVAEEQASLFGKPSTREEVDAERRRRDARRDGKNGTGRTDMAAGDGELFAGDRPDQSRIEDGDMLRHGTDAWHEAVDEMLQAHGQPVENSVDANRRWNNGERIFAMHEQAEDVTEITSHAMLESYAPDQLLAVPRSLAEDYGISERPGVEASRDMFVPTRGDRAAQGENDGRGKDGEGRPERAGNREGEARPQNVRPDWTPGLERRGKYAIESLVRRYRGSTLADTLAREFEEAHGAQLIGKRVTSAKDLAAIADVYRNPIFETLRYVFVDADGGIVGESAVSSRKAGSSHAFPGGDASEDQDNLAWLREITPANATGLWIMHNHPSGNPSPSTADLAFTKNLDRLLTDGRMLGMHVPKLSGHVVLNHKRFSHITPEGRDTGEHTLEGAELPDPLREHIGDVPKESIGHPVDAAVYGKRIFSLTPENSVAILVGGARGELIAAMAFPEAVFASPRGFALVSTLAKRSGAMWVTAVADADVIARNRRAISLASKRHLLRDLIEVSKDGSLRSLAVAGRIDSSLLGKQTKSQAEREGLQVYEDTVGAIEGGTQEFAPAKPPYVPVVDLPSRRPGESQAAYANRVRKGAREEMRQAKDEAGTQRKIGRANFRAMLAKQARMADVADAVFHEYRKLFDSAERKTLLEGIDQWETGRHVENADLRNFFDLMDSLFADRIERLRAAKPGALKELVENYFPHIWEDTGKAGQWYSANTKRPLDGNKSFLKQRTWGTIKEGMASGLRPVSYNPVDLALLKLGQMDKFITFNEFKNDLKERGWLKQVKAGERLPDGYALIDSPAFKGEHAFIAKGEEGEADKAAVAHWNWAVPELIAKDVNNYLSPSLYRFGGWKAMRYVQNVLMSTRLGFSMFHAGFTTLDNAVTHGSIGLNRLLQGDLPGALTEFAYIPVSPIVAPFHGGQLGKAWRGKVLADPHTQALLMALEEGGARRLQTAHQQDFNNALGSIARKIRRLRAPGAIRDTEAGIRALLAGPKSEAAAKAGKAAIAQAGELIGAVGELSSWLIHQKLVPAQKMNARVALLKFELDRLAAKLGKKRGDYKGIIEAMHPDALRQVAGRVVDNVDDRLGQMNYDNQFWNKTAREIAQAVIGAVGWQVGTVRTVTGGVRDLQRLATPEPLVSALDKEGTITDAHMGRLTNRVTNLLVLGTMMSAASILTQLALTGDPPEEPKDFFFPRTGRKNRDDSDERLQFPTYWMDHYKLATHPLQTAGHKVHPSIGMALEVFGNKDFYGTEVRDENAPLSTQIAQVGEYFAKGFIPYSVTGQGKLEENDAGLAARVGNFFGFTVAPASVSRSKFQAFVADKAAESAPQGARSLAQAERSRHLREVEASLRKGGDPDMADLTEREQKNARKAAGMQAPEIRFKRLSLEDKVHAWDLATPEERERYHLRDAIVGKDRTKDIAKLPDEDQDYMRQRLEEIRSAH